MSEEKKHAEPDGEESMEEQVEEQVEEQEEDEHEGEEQEEDEQDEDEQVEDEQVEVKQDDGPLDLDSRILCPDGSCIGVIGPDGKCKVCGTPMNPADAPVLERERDREEKEEGLAEASEGEGDVKKQEARGIDDGCEDDSPPDLDGRVLCPDGSCIGVIGPDGRCKVCGREAGDIPDEA